MELYVFENLRARTLSREQRPNIEGKNRETMVTEGNGESKRERKIRGRLRNILT